MKVFFSNYHISVNNCFVDDILATGNEVVVPSQAFGESQIGFFAGNHEHYMKQGVLVVEYDQFLTLEPMAIVLNCSQMYDDIMKLYRARGEVDQIVFLSSQVGIGEWVSEKTDWHSDFLISHSIDWHRKSPAKYKMLYYNRPKVLQSFKNTDEMRVSFEQKKIKLYINHFENELKYMAGGNFAKEHKEAVKLRELWEKEYNWKIPFYGAENPDGYLSIDQVQANIKDSMFTLVFKGHETWGQMVNESMQIGTPCIFLRKFLVDMFTEHLINEDTAIVGDTVEEIFKKIKNLTFEQYESLCWQAYSSSNMYCADFPRQKHLGWLLTKVQKNLTKN